MNDEDLRDCAALLRAVTGASAEECFAFADEFMEARKKEKDDEESIGIASVAKRTYRRKS
jgi:hypothetical protein